MDGEQIIYRPYRSHIVFAYVANGISLISLILAGVFLADSISIELLIFVLVACLGVLLAYYFAESSKVMIVFEEKGLRIINDRRNKYYCTSWKKHSFGYYERSYKGHGFLVLSTEKLSKERVKKLANSGANLTKVCIEEVIVIYLDGVQDTSKIKAIVEKNVSLMGDMQAKKSI